MKRFRMMVGFKPDKKKALYALAEKRGYKTLSRYVRELVLKDLESDEK